MENLLINKMEVSMDRIFNTGSIKKHPAIPPHIVTQVQFLISRTDELKTILNEIDETLNKIKEETLKNLPEEYNTL